MTTNPNHPMPPSLGRYEIVQELGHGAMGIVYEGRDPTIGRRVAIKTARRDMLDASGQPDELMERFLREARSAGGLNHPNIVTIYDAGEDHGLAYIAMEFLEGRELRDRINCGEAFDAEEAVELTSTLCEALHHAHQQGIVHRDVKPSNLMLLASGLLKVTDFGIARVSNSELTRDGSLIGTPYYMSPEQFLGRKVDGRADLFAAGIILYELLTGEKPFPGEAISTVMHHVLKTEPVPPRELNPAIPEGLNKVLLKVLRKDPAERYASGANMAAALRESLKPQPDPSVLEPEAGQTLVLDATAVQATAVPGLSEKAAADEATVGAVPPGAENHPRTKAGHEDTPPTVHARMTSPSDADRTTALGSETTTVSETHAASAEKPGMTVRPAWVVGVLAAVLLVAAPLYWALQPEETIGNAGGATGPSYATIVLDVEVFPSLAEEIAGAEPLEDPESELTLTVVDLEDGEPIVQARPVSDKERLRLPENSGRLDVLVAYDGEEREIQAQAEESGKVLEVPFVFYED